MRHKFQMLPMAFVLLLASCAVSSRQLPPGELGRQFSSTIPGTWTGASHEGGSTCAMVKTYRRDGSAEGVLYFKHQATPGVSVVMPEVPFISRWRVKGDVIECYDIQTEYPGMFKQGLIIRDRLISVSPNKIVSRSEKTNEKETLTRVR